MVRLGLGVRVREVRVRLNQRGQVGLVRLGLRVRVRLD